MLIAICLSLWLTVTKTANTTPDLQYHQRGTLVIYSTTDKAVFEPVIQDFKRLYRNVSVRYLEIDAAELHRRHLADVSSGRVKADLLLSSAMDLQVKLVNDGYAEPHISFDGNQLPFWAKWRSEAFGITFEPAVIVFNKGFFANRTMPKSRPELLTALKTDAVFWKGRVGTYDLQRSSVGYLLAAEDARQSSEFGSLLEAFGDAQLRTYATSAELLNAIEAGEVVLGYNVLGSYAQLRIDQGAPLSISYPQDYTLAVSRTAIIPKNAPHPSEAHAFLEYLLSLRGQKILTAESRLGAVRPEIEGPYGRLGLSERRLGPLRPIVLGPGLLAYVDQEKHRRLFETWQQEIGDNKRKLRTQSLTAP